MNESKTDLAAHPNWLKCIIDYADEAMQTTLLNC